MTSTTVYKFGQFILSPTKRELYKDSERLKLSDRDFDVLLYLIKNRPNVSSMNEIIEAVWAGTNVENNSVEKAIVNLRNILGDNIKSPMFIKTVRTKGYLFIGDVEKVDETPVRDIPSKKERSDTLSRITKLKPRTILIYSGLFILLVFFGLLWWKGSEIWKQFNSKIVFADDFSENRINPDLWSITGKTVKVEDGIAKIITSETDVETYLKSKLFSFDPKKPIVVKSRIKVSYSKNIKDKVYFNGFFGLTPDTDLIEQTHIRNYYIFGIKYTNYDHETFYPDGEIDEIKAEGFFLFRDGGASIKKRDYRDGKISKRIEPVWDQWFDQKLIYDPIKGEMSYFINDELKDTFIAGDLYKNLRNNQIRLEICPSGWWVNHTIELDYIEVLQ